MKAAVVSGILLAVIALLILINAAYVNRTVDALVAAVEALPSTPQADTCQQVTHILSRLQSVETVLSLSVPYPAIDRSIELCRSLLCYAETGAENDYAMTRDLLTDALRDMGRLERLQTKNIF